MQRRATARYSPLNNTCRRHGLCYIANALQHVRSRLNLLGKPVLAVLLVGLVLLLNTMAALPAVHELIHQDADEHGHQCAVTLFAHGQVDSPVMEVAAIIPVAPFEFLPLTSVSIFNALVETLPPGRGPPVSLLHS
jgi:hypothetical protein